MKSSKLVFIIDQSEAYLRTKIDEVAKGWGVDRSNVKEITSWSNANIGPSLFDDIIITHLNLNNNTDLKHFADLISKKETSSSFSSPGWMGDGLIITTMKAVGIKKIEALVSESGGTTLKKEVPKTRKIQLLSQLSLSPEVMGAIDSFVGDEYELLLSFYNEVSKLTKADQSALTIEGALSLFPPTPGGVPPWDYLNALLNGSTRDSISLYYRTVKHTHVLVLLSLLKKKMNSLLYISGALSEGITSEDEIRAAIGMKKAGGDWALFRSAKKTNFITLVKINELIEKLESDIKGGSSVDPNVLFEATLAHIGLLLGNR